MAIYKRGYQRYQGPLTGHGARLLVLPRFAWERLFQQRLVVALMIISLVWPLLCAGFIYIANHSELWASFGPGVSKLLEIDGKFFIVFMNAQSFFALLLAALAGPGLVAPDLANNALPLYFSRPLSRFDYVIAKLLVLVGMLSLVTWVPGLLLFWLQTGMAGGGWFSANWQLGVGIFVGFLAWILIVSLVALASSALVKWRMVAGALVLGFFFLLAGAGAMVNAVLRVTWGSLLNPALAMYRIWCDMLGVDPPPGLAELVGGRGSRHLDTAVCIAILVALAVLLALVLRRKLRPVEVIS